jgi:microcompartment protein CcmL/EutN
MKKHPAMAVIEFRDIAVGMQATDAMLKKSPIGFIKCGTISRGRYMTLIGGTTASVDESYQEGLFWGKDSVLDHVMLADVHPQLHDAILGQRRPALRGSLAIIETGTVSPNIRAAEHALKGTTVELVEIRLADRGLSGKGISIFQGELYEIEAAIELALADLERANTEVVHKIITSPHDALIQQVDVSSFFGASNLLELDGEKVS